MDRKLEVIDFRRLSRKRIVTIAELISHDYGMSFYNTPPNYFTLNFDSVWESFIYPEYEINLEEGDDLGYVNGEKVFGCYEPEPNTIFLDATLNDKDDLNHHRKGFTFWHELGHAFLHGGWLREHPSVIDKRIMTTEISLSPNARAKMEQQANLFASRAAVPQWFLNLVLQTTFDLNRPIRYTGPAQYQLRAWGVKQYWFAKSFNELCRNIAYPIRHRFGGLSIEAISYRIQESDYVIDLMNKNPRDTGSPLYRTSPVSAAGVMVGV